MKVKLLNLENTKSETIEISDKILKHKINYKLIKSVVDYVKKNVKYKAEEGAPNRKAFYTVYIKAG